MLPGFMHHLLRTGEARSRLLQGLWRRHQAVVVGDLVSGDAYLAHIRLSPHVQHVLTYLVSSSNSYHEDGSKEALGSESNDGRPQRRVGFVAFGVGSEEGGGNCLGLWLSRQTNTITLGYPRLCPLVTLQRLGRDRRHAASLFNGHLPGRARMACCSSAVGPLPGICTAVACLLKSTLVTPAAKRRRHSLPPLLVYPVRTSSISFPALSFPLLSLSSFPLSSFTHIFFASGSLFFTSTGHSVSRRPSSLAPPHIDTSAPLQLSSQGEEYSVSSKGRWLSLPFVLHPWPLASSRASSFVSSQSRPACAWLVCSSESIFLLHAPIPCEHFKSFPSLEAPRTCHSFERVKPLHDSFPAIILWPSNSSSNPSYLKLPLSKHTFRLQPS